MTITLVNGIVSDSHRVWVEDLSWIQAYQCFETMRTYRLNQVIIFWEEAHIKRLYQSSITMGFEHELSEIQQDLLKIYPNLKGDEIIRYVLTPHSRIMIIQDYLAPRFPTKTMASYLEPTKKNTQIPAYVKHSQRADWLFAKKKLNVDELLLYDEQGYLKESDASAIAVIDDDMIYLPIEDENILPSITRKAWLRLADLYHIPYQIKDIHLTQKREALFLMGTIKELSPVTQLDQKKLWTSENKLMKDCISCWIDATKKLDFCLS
jgi:branched-subunit amino acid aminotransferase/4-amino-4-deoxychorismate lyase